MQFNAAQFEASHSVYTPRRVRESDPDISRYAGDVACFDPISREFLFPSMRELGMTNLDEYFDHISQFHDGTFGLVHVGSSCANDEVGGLQSVFQRQFVGQSPFNEEE